MKVCNGGARHYLNLTHQKGSLLCSSKSPEISNKASEITSTLSSFLEKMLSDTHTLPHNSTHYVMVPIFSVFFSTLSQKSPVDVVGHSASAGPRVRIKPVLEIF